MRSGRAGRGELEGVREVPLSALRSTSVLVELKTVEQLLRVHAAQTATYLRLSGLDAALLINFNVTALRMGLRRFSKTTGSPSPISP